jgi:hypothetical protein
MAPPFRLEVLTITAFGVVALAPRYRGTIDGTFALTSDTLSSS